VKRSLIGLIVAAVLLHSWSMILSAQGVPHEEVSRSQLVSWQSDCAHQLRFSRWIRTWARTGD
jgi:hypothetical protein